MPTNYILFHTIWCLFDTVIINNNFKKPRLATLWCPRFFKPVDWVIHTPTPLVFLKTRLSSLCIGAVKPDRKGQYMYVVKTEKNASVFALESMNLDNQRALNTKQSILECVQAHVHPLNNSVCTRMLTLHIWWYQNLIAKALSVSYVEVSIKLISFFLQNLKNLGLLG